MMRRAGLLAGPVLLLAAACTSSHHTLPPGGPPSNPPASSSSSSPSDRPSTVDDWPAYHGNAQRIGVSRDLPAPGALRANRVDLDAAVYASPVIAGGTTIVATENDTVYALDGAGRQLWRAHLGEPARSSDLPCGNIDPSGIIGTPVVEGGVVYAVAEYRDPVRHELVALSVRDGTVRWRVGVDLPGADPKAMQERGALTVAAGRVWVPFGGRAGDCGDYKGRVVGLPLSGQGAPIAYTVPTPREGGIWTPPGPVVDGKGRLLVAVGNGENGPGDAYDYSDSVLAIDPATARLADSFSPTTWAHDNSQDLDLGSQGPTLVGPWVFTAGKSGTAYVLRAGHFGGIGGEVSQAPVCRSFGGTAVSGDVVYVPCTDGVRAVRIDAAGTMHGLWHASDSIAGSPVVGGGRVWALDQGGGVLHALDPASGRSVASVQVGPTSRFATPALSGHHVLVPTLRGLTLVTV